MSLPIEQKELSANKIQVFLEAYKRVKRILESGEVEIVPGVVQPISPAVRTLLQARLDNFLATIDQERTKL